MWLPARLRIVSQARLIVVLAVLCVAAALTAGMYVFSIYDDFRRDFSEVEFPLLDGVNKANIELSAVQIDLLSLIERARTRKVVEGEVYREGRELIDRFDGVQGRLPALFASSHLHDAYEYLLAAPLFQFRAHLVSAVEMLSVDPALAEQHARRVTMDALLVNRNSAQLLDRVNDHLNTESWQLKATLLKLVSPFGLMLLVMAVVVALLNRLSRNIARTFTDLRLVLARLRNGETGGVIELSGCCTEAEEIRSALERFRATLLDLASLQARLEAEVSERTAQLQAANLQLAEQLRLLSLAQNDLRLFKRVFESTSEAIIITALDGTVLDVNDAYVAISGYKREEIVGQNPRVARSGRHDDAFYRQMWQSILEQGCWIGEIWDRRRNGELYPKLLSINTVYDEAHRPACYVGAFSDISDLKAAEAQLEQMAYFDRLTGLPNRRLLLDRVAQALTRARRNAGYGAVYFLDLDKFKSINDALGHQLGDELLIEVACRLKACVRESDTVGRLAGDEYLVLAESLDADPEQAACQARRLGEKIITALSTPYLLGDQQVHTSASVGVALFDGGFADSVDALITEADTAMYEAKKSGRGVLSFFDPAMQAAQRSRLSLEAQIRQALQDDAFDLHLQPQFDMDGQCAGVEALVRLKAANGELISPVTFIPLAEEVHLIREIDNWVLDAVCKLLKRWDADALLMNVPVAINISVQHFCDERFVTDVSGIVGRHAVAPNRIMLELTESVVMADIEKAIEKMQYLQGMGFQIAMDDFGTGHSSLSYLRRLPFNQIKIDRSFVSAMLDNKNDMFIVDAVLTMSRLINARIVAEGVETQAQFDALRELDCALYQGYLFSPPLPVPAVEESLRSTVRRT